MLKWISLCAWACALASNMAFAEKSPPLNPGQDFSIPMMKIYSPHSEGWRVQARSNGLLAFKKDGAAAEQTYVATVQFMRLATFPNADAFTEFVREAVVKEAPTNRFDVLETSVQYSEERAYPCVKYKSVSVDKKSRVSLFVTKRLKLQVVALYCQYPDRPGVGYAVSFSLRGEVEQNIDADAASFIDSVQIPSAAAPKE
jgi:hypothetical protein